MQRYIKYRAQSGCQVLAWLLLAVLYTGCSSKKEGEKAQTMTKGTVTIVADEAYKPILEDQKFIYQMRYPETEFTMIYTGEDSAYNSLIHHAAPLVVISFEPEEKHMKYFKEKGFPLNICPIAYDGIVAVVNKDCPLEKLTRSQLTQVLNGRISDWSQLIPGNTNGRIWVGFNRQGSGIINFFRKNYLGENAQFAPGSGTFKNTLALLDTMRAHNNLLGFIPYNYISDKDDSLTRAIKRDFKIISLESATDSSRFVLPSQSTIADSSYPLRRRVLVINHEGRSGLGTGFVIFMASHQGQRAMLKAGLVPATMPGRVIRIIKKNIGS